MIDEVKFDRQIHYYRKMLNVQRLTGTPKLRSYNLAEHSFFVALLFQEFAKIENIDYDVNVLNAVLKHDFLEVLTADLPYHVKNLSEETKEAWDVIENAVVEARRENFIAPLMSDEDIHSALNDEQFLLMKSCDILELLIFCKEEYELGNHSKAILVVLNNCFEIEKKYNIRSIVDYVERLKIEMFMEEL